MTLPVVGYAGLTHLGLVYGASAAEKGFRVIAHDPDTALVERIARGELPVNEPGLDDVYRRRNAAFTYSADPASLAAADIVFISADVATDDQGCSDLTRTMALIEAAGRNFHPGALLVILCQVPPGFTRALPFDKGRLYYQVETLVFGQALVRALEPERIIVGSADASRELPASYAAYLGAYGCPVLNMGYESAELTKISPALKLDRRIGQYSYLSPGLGIAGGNLERDLATVIRFAEQHGTDAGVVKAWVANSRHRKRWAARTLREVVLKANPQAVVAVWGLAYKENTHSVKNSPSLATIAELTDVALRVHDPVVPASAAAYPRTTGAADPLAAASGADALMILTPWPQYRVIAPEEIARAMRGRTVLDPYGVLDPARARETGLDVYTLGRAPALAGGQR
jgi:UDPglucose 6-dehydrogenase